MLSTRTPQQSRNRIDFAVLICADNPIKGGFRHSRVLVTFQLLARSTRTLLLGMPISRRSLTSLPSTKYRRNGGPGRFADKRPDIFPAVRATSSLMVEPETPLVLPLSISHAKFGSFRESLPVTSCLASPRPGSCRRL